MVPPIGREQGATADGTASRMRRRRPVRRACEDAGMELWEIVVLAIVAAAALLFVGGYVGNARMNAARDRRLRERIAEADRALAAARASDRGWDRPLLDAAARSALEARRPGIQIERMEL